jgi:hypothetical protein
MASLSSWVYNAYLRIWQGPDFQAAALDSGAAVVDPLVMFDPDYQLPVADFFSWEMPRSYGFPERRKDCVYSGDVAHPAGNDEADRTARVLSEFDG